MILAVGFVGLPCTFLDHYIISAPQHRMLVAYMLSCARYITVLYFLFDDSVYHLRTLPQKMKSWKTDTHLDGFSFWAFGKRAKLLRWNDCHGEV